MAKDESAIGELYRAVVWMVVAYWLIRLGYLGWYHEYRFAFWYDTPIAQVFKEKEPHDCEWIAAPLGDKNCHYDAVVSTVRVRVRVSDLAKPGQEVSYDEGATWVPDESVPPAAKAVYLMWKKIAD